MTKSIRNIIFFITLNILSLSANPVIVFYINEIIPDSASFKLEIINNDFFSVDSLDGWYITSKTDTAYIKNGISIKDTFFVITQDSLTTPLSLDPENDIITLYSPQGKLDAIHYGKVNNSNIAAPKKGHSICLHEYWGEFQHYYYYFDSTPTIGSANDSSGAMGYIEGTVVDDAGNPVPGLELIYDNLETLEGDNYYTITTDSSGYFLLENISKRISFHLKTESGYGEYFLTVQIYPNDTTAVKIIYTPNAINDDRKNYVPSAFSLEPNYPNPFNNSTSFYYYLEKREYIELSIYDLRGRLVEQLYSGFKNTGKYRMTWHTSNIPSGIYIIQLSSPTKTITRKCVYLK